MLPVRISGSPNIGGAARRISGSGLGLQVVAWVALSTQTPAFWRERAALSVTDCGQGSARWWQL